MKKITYGLLLVTMVAGCLFSSKQADAKYKIKHYLNISGRHVQTGGNFQVDLTDGQSTSLCVKYTPNYKKVTKKAKFKVANKKICTVSKTGKVKAKKEGHTKITITYKDAKKTIPVSVVNNHYKEDAKKLVATSGADAFHAIAIDKALPFKTLVVCHKDQGYYVGATDKYTFYNYVYYYKKEAKKYIYEFNEIGNISIIYRDGDTPLLDYNQKWCIVYSMLYHRINSRSPLSVIGVKFHTLGFNHGYGASSRYRPEGYIPYVDFVLAKETKDPSKSILINYLGDDYYISQGVSKLYDTYFTNRITCRLLANTEANRNLIPQK